jgi:hypothetical protein
MCSSLFDCSLKVIVRFTENIFFMYAVKLKSDQILL